MTSIRSLPAYWTDLRQIPLSAVLDVIRLRNADCWSLARIYVEHPDNMWSVSEIAETSHPAMLTARRARQLRNMYEVLTTFLVFNRSRSNNWVTEEHPRNIPSKLSHWDVSSFSKSNLYLRNCQTNFWWRNRLWFDQSLQRNWNYGGARPDMV